MYLVNLMLKFHQCLLLGKIEMCDTFLRSSVNHAIASLQEMLIFKHASNKIADQSAHPRSLISAFVVRPLNKHSFI